MKTWHILALLAFFGTFCAIASPTDLPTEESLADQMHDSIRNTSRLVVIGGGPESQSTEYRDSVNQLMQQFYYDQFRHFQDPESPYFLFLSRDAKLAMGVGGCVRMRGYYDWGGAIPAPGFAPYLIPMSPEPTQMRKFGTTPAGTCLFFRVIGRNKSLGNYSLYIEANFNGYQSRDFHLKKAYATINAFTIGYASSTFSDPAAVPATVDAQGPNNKLAQTSVLVRWMPRVKERWVFAISAETPSTSIGADGVYNKKVDEWLPDFAAFAQYEWGPTSHIRLSGIVRNLAYRDMVTATNHNLPGIGVQLSGVGHPIPPVTVYGTFNAGKGYAGLGGDLLVGAYDLMPVLETPGKMTSPRSYGWNVGVQYNFRPNLFASVSISQSRLLPSHRVMAEEYRYGMAGDVNIFWNLTPRIQVAAEFDMGKRKNMNGESRWAKRVGALAQFSF